MLEPIGVSVASVPLCWGPGGPERMARVLVETGLYGIQLLPLRGWWEFDKVFPRNDPRVISFEDRWGTHVQDWVLFGGVRRSNSLLACFQADFPHALEVEHEWGSPIMELHPGLPLTTLPHLLNCGSQVILDTWHITRRGYLGEDPVTAQLGKPSQEIAEELVDSDSLAMVHFQPARGVEWDESESRRLRSMLRPVADSQTQIPVIIEVPPILEFQQGTIERLKTVMGFIQSI